MLKECSHEVLLICFLERASAGAFGGPGEVRTPDLFHAMEARSQLRHRPNL
jgi:hypothetical protein